MREIAELLKIRAEGLFSSWFSTSVWDVVGWNSGRRPFVTVAQGIALGGDS
jgi:hypothetical protein